MQFHFAPNGPVSLQSLRKSSSRKNMLRVLLYLTFLALNITNFFELKAIYRLLNQVYTQHSILNLKEIRNV